jgi:hypothetical protein
MQKPGHRNTRNRRPNRWAWDGGAKKLRENLDSHLTLLNVFYTRYATLLPQRNCDDLTYLSVLVQRQFEGASEPRPSRPSINTNPTIVDFNQQALMLQAAPSTTHSFSESPSSKPDAYAFSFYPVWDGARFLVFSILTLLCVAVILIVASFGVIGVILFPFAEIPTGFARCKRHWKRFNGFFRRLFNKIFRFVDGLWD